MEAVAGSLKGASKAQLINKLQNSRRRRSTSLNLDLQPENEEVRFSSESLDWDPFTPPLNATGASRWSSDTQYDVSLLLFDGNNAPAELEDIFHEAKSSIGSPGSNGTYVSSPSSDSPLNRVF